MEKLEDWMSKAKLHGWDPFGGLKSPSVKYLTLNNKYLRIAWEQSFKRYPIDLRPVVRIKKGIVQELWVTRRQLTDGENGFIVKKHSPQQIAEKLLLLCANKEFRWKMGQTNRERFLKYYTKDIFIRNLGKIFEEVLSG